MDSIDLYSLVLYFFFFNDPATTEIYTLSLHDALPIWSVYELLENADNIGSKNVKFELDNGKLLVKNDGLCFTNEDFKRICSVNTLINRNSLIDRSFGFGFKSVFNVSNDVRIFSNKIGSR